MAKTYMKLDGNLIPISVGTVGSGPKEEQTKTVTEPNFASGNVVVTPDSFKVLTRVTVVKDNDLVPENIVKDVNIFGVVGTAETGGGATMIELTSDSSCAEKVQSFNLLGTYYMMGQIYPMPLTAQLNKTSIEHNHDLIQAIFSQNITSIKSELISYIQTDTADIGIPLLSELEGMILSYIGFAADPTIQASGVRHISFSIRMSKENEADKNLSIRIGKRENESYDYDDLMKNAIIDLGDLLGEDGFELVFFYTDTSMPTTIELYDTNTIGTYSDYLSLLNNGWTAKIDISTSY